MLETIKDCKCIDRDDKHELSKAILARIEIYKKGRADAETEQIIEKVEIFNKGELEIKPSTQMIQYKEIINRLGNLYNRLENTPEC